MIEIKKPTCLGDFEVLVEGILRTGKPAMINFHVINREDAVLRALALLGIRFGRDQAMLEALVGNAELVEPAEGVTYAIRQDDGSYIFADRFDQLKSSVYSQMCE
jgi:hypothetical protein